MDFPYMDKPTEIEDWIETLTDKERNFFEIGFVVAIHGLLEGITDTKRKLLDKIIAMEKSELKTQYLSRVYMLDLLEKRYRERLTVLEPSLQL